MAGFSTASPTNRKMTENESMGRAYGRGVGFFLGEPCENKCNEILFHVYCNESTKQCECQEDYPVKIKQRYCAKVSKLGDFCEYLEACAFSDENSVCHEDKKCRCAQGFFAKPEGDGLCLPGKTTGFMDNSDMTTMISVIGGLMIFTALFCLVLRLFSRARFERPQDRIGNASAPAVVLTSLESGNIPPSSVGSSRRASRSSGSNQEPFKGRRHSFGVPNLNLAPPSLSGRLSESSGEGGVVVRHPSHHHHHVFNPAHNYHHQGLYSTHVQCGHLANPMNGHKGFSSGRFVHRSRTNVSVDSPPPHRPSTPLASHHQQPRPSTPPVRPPDL